MTHSFYTILLFHFILINIKRLKGNRFIGHEQQIIDRVTAMTQKKSNNSAE